jgi:hypothetical protein
MNTELQIYVRHPSEGLIKFLMTQQHEQAEEDKWVHYEVCARGYPPPNPEYLAALRTSLLVSMPTNFDPTDKMHRPSTKFLRSEGIYGLYHPDDAARAATELVSNTRVRAVVEQLLLGRLTSKEIAYRINKRMGVEISPDGIEAYKQYYWNTERLRVEEWATLLANHDAQRERVMAILECGGGLALHLNGFQQQVESKQMLREMLESVYWDLREWSQQPRSAAKTKAIGSLARAACLLDTQMTGKDAEISKAMQSFEQLRLKTEGKAVPDIRDLAPLGNFTGSGERMLEVVSDDSEPDKKGK